MLNIKNLTLTILSVFLLINPVQAKKFKAVMVTDVAGLGDKSFNDVAWRGMRKAEEKLGIEIACLQSYEQADYISNLNMAAQDADLVIAMGFLLAEAVEKVAGLHSEKHFIFIDGKIQAHNVASFDYKSEEGAYLAGIIAAAVSKTNIVGIVEGMEIPPVKTFEAGFRAGVKTANSYFKKKVDVRVVVAGSFNDPSKGKSLSNSLLGQGTDVIFQLAGNTGLGVFEAVKDSPKKIFVIGSDLNQDAIVPGRVLTSVLKKTENAAFNAIKSAQRGQFKAGHYRLGLANGAVGITPLDHTQNIIPPAALKLVAKSKEEIISNRLKIPNRIENIAAFQVPTGWLLR